MTRRLLETAVVASQSLVAQTSVRLDAVLAEHRLTGATAQALWAIDPDEKPPSMKTMAQRLYCNAPNLTFVTTQLADRGLVERVVDPADRRSRLVSLTPEGLRVRAVVIKAALEASPLAHLGEEHLAQLVEILRAALDTAADEASVS
ncbi:MULTISPECIES: MarR family winged helix-turn-helix transcriptional regulator [Pseudonocardia]|uniref:MarR family protein n=2 Tax=Pseudonocardia TaxID=1847 RepID=A0A1Y2MME5_PSEAH|nr:MULTISPECIES: MarR family winged helix-turn-helix transcriptional regulator [Pseudonocardia]OSY35628.1 MarR family protein [Pseudonocardia autotrophica]TDN76919.1 DNA-binding MarR family transcriptional regulator [Pseudonocardia autotrophica]BBG00922.1 DNA-binding protein [Pseudonocardia autotrophica]GEC27519.1 DNA-binding protein [Pseudonocardia saturnea]